MHILLLKKERKMKSDNDIHVYQYSLPLWSLPNVPRLGDGRTYASELLESSVIRVLSPRIDPPVLAEEGSTAYLVDRKTLFLSGSSHPTTRRASVFHTYQD